LLALRPLNFALMMTWPCDGSCKTWLRARPIVSVMELSEGSRALLATGPTIRIKDLLVVVESFRAFVTMRAERLELAGQEPIPIATMRFHVVRDRGQGRDAALQAECAQGLTA
jgi:hypothetical protein